MREINIKYNTSSTSRQERRDRLQLLGASIGITLGFWETFDLYRSIYVTIPVIGFSMAFINIVIAKFYNIFRARYEDKFDILLFKLNGVVMLITGIGFHINESQYGKYAYYILALYFFIVSPYFLTPAKKKKLFIRFNSTRIVINKLFFKPVVYTWDELESIMLNQDVLHLKNNRSKKSRKYYVAESDKEKIPGVIDFLHDIKSQGNHAFEIGG